MEKITNTLNNYGILGVELLKASVRSISATGKTERSISYKVKSDNDSDTLTIYAREYFSTIETGRGPRKSAQESGFLDGMLEYMRAKGIGNDLDEKKKKNLARFLVLKINKEGDSTYKKGGRQVYSNDLEKYVEALKGAVVKDFRLTFRSTITDALHGNNNT